MLRRRTRLRLRLIIALFGASLLVWILLPYDNALRLSVRFNVGNAVRSVFANDRWLRRPPTFPVDLAEDVAIIVKTGFGTRNRAAAWLEALGETSILNGLLVIGDFSTQSGQHLNYHGHALPIHDMIDWMLERELVGSELLHPRLAKYSRLKHAIARNDSDAALEFSRSFGWELDAMKFISGLELGYRLMPHKKWYILVDDDTYLVRPSLEVILGHFDSSVPYYIGNAIGDYRSRFAHGGSSVILSKAAMRRLLLRNSRAVSAAHLQSLTETWGDRLLATILMKVGIYVEEGYGRYFNGERPHTTKIRPDRFCGPVTTFHNLSPTDMLQTGQTFANFTKPVSWIDIWKICKAPALESFGADPIRHNRDHVGRLDEYTTTIDDVRTAEYCSHACYRHSKSCLAWTWEAETGICHNSPWMIPGAKAAGKFSGVNVARVQRLARRCPGS